MRNWALSIVTLVATTSPTRASAEELRSPVPALARFRLPTGGTLLLSPEPERATITACAAGRGTPAPLADPVVLARHGGVERDESRHAASAACVSLPRSELPFAIATVSARIGAAEATRTVDAPESWPALARSLALEGIDESGSAGPPFVIVIAGSLDAAGERLVRSTLDATEAGADPATPWTPHQTTERIAVLDGDRDTPLVQYLWTVPDGSAIRSASLSIAFDFLGGGAKSRLRELLVRRGLARDVVQIREDGRGGSLFGVVVESSSRGALDRIRGFVDGALKQLRLVGPSTRDVARLVAQRKLATLRSWDDVEERALTLALAEASGRPSNVAEDLAAFAAVSPEQVRSAAHDSLVDSRRTTLEIHPKNSPEDDPAHAHDRLYTVVSGDTLDAIAQRFHVDPGKLARENDVDPRYRLTEGQPLWVP